MREILFRGKDKDGKLSVISKDKIKLNIGRSIDEADCIMMRMLFELKPPITGGRWAK